MCSYLGHGCHSRCWIITDALAETIWGLVAEYGLVAPKELIRLRATIPCWLEDTDNGLTERFRRLLQGLWQDLLTLDERMAQLDQEISQLCAEDPVARRLSQIRGIGSLTATALLAAVGDAAHFSNGRKMAAC